MPGLPELEIATSIHVQAFTMYLPTYIGTSTTYLHVGSRQLHSMYILGSTMYIYKASRDCRSSDQIIGIRVTVPPQVGTHIIATYLDLPTYVLYGDLTDCWGLFLLLGSMCRYLFTLSLLR